MSFFNGITLAWFSCHTAKCGAHTAGNFTWLLMQRTCYYKTVNCTLMCCNFFTCSATKRAQSVFTYPPFRVKLCSLPHSVYWSCVIIRMDIDYFHWEQLICCYLQWRQCFRRGENWIFKLLWGTSKFTRLRRDTPPAKATNSMTIPQSVIKHITFGADTQHTSRSKIILLSEVTLTICSPNYSCEFQPSGPN